MSTSAQKVLVEIVRGTTRLGELAAALGAERKNVALAVQRLRQRGLVELLGRGVYAPTTAGRDFLTSGRKLTSGRAGPKPRTRTRGLRERAWWVIRARKDVSVNDLLSVLSDGSERDARGNLQRYLHWLALTGYLAKVVRGTAPVRYRLVRDSGRLAPVMRLRQGLVFDPNTGAVRALETTEQATAQGDSDERGA